MIEHTLPNMRLQRIGHALDSSSYSASAILLFVRDSPRRLQPTGSSGPTAERQPVSVLCLSYLKEKRAETELIHQTHYGISLSSISQSPKGNGSPILRVPSNCVVRLW